MLLRGVSAKVISEALGHASVAFTMDVYSHIISGMQENAMALLDDVLPTGVDVTTRLTRKLRLNIPLLSAAMDTVTNSEMAIAMARAGGIGIVHKNYSPDDQAAEVKTSEYDPNRSCNIALVQYPDGEKRYMLAPQGLKVGQQVYSGYSWG